MTSDAIRARSAETHYQRPRSGVLSPEMRRQALDRGVAVVVIEDVRDDWTRQAIINEARRQIGASGYGGL